MVAMGCLPTGALTLALGLAKLVGDLRACLREDISTLPWMDDATRAKAIVKATTHYNDAKIVLDASEELGEAMKGIDVRQLEEKDLLQTRGW